MVVALALLLAAASFFDVQTRRIPNSLVAAGLVVGLAGHLWHGSLLWSLAGIAAGLPLLLLYAIGVFGAGDIKLLMAVGALMGPAFLLWTLAGAVFAGGVLALIWVIGKGLRTRSTLPRSSRMPFAPAIALGAVFAFAQLKLL